jgi:hypothetical protein
VNCARGPTIFASIGEVRPRDGSIPLSMTSEPVVFVSVVTTACWKSTGDACATPGVASSLSTSSRGSVMGVPIE